MDFNAFLSFPMIYNEKVYGVLDFYLDRYTMEEEDIHIISVMANLGALILENTFLTEKTRENSILVDKIR